MTRFLQEVEHAFWIVGPVVLFFKVEIFKWNFNDPLVFKVSWEETQDLILTLSCSPVGTKCNGSWEDMPTIIVSVFTDQINPSWWKESVVSLFPKDSLEFCL